METLIAFLIGLLFATGIYCLMRRSIVRLAIGVILISQATNLLVFSAGGMKRGEIPIIGESQKTLSGDHADPLPQALVLTAIVIGFGFISFTLALIQVAYKKLGHDDVEHLKETDKLT